MLREGEFSENLITVFHHHTRTPNYRKSYGESHIKEPISDSFRKCKEECLVKIGI